MSDKTDVNDKTKIFRHDEPFALESGSVLPAYHLAYTTHGKLNAAGNNVVWVFHALTANSDPVEWWPGLVGERAAERRQRRSFRPRQVRAASCKND